MHAAAKRGVCMREDIDPVETREWLDALDSLVEHAGKGRTASLLFKLAEHAVDLGVELPAAITTHYSNTILPAWQQHMPGDLFMERRIRSLIRWNALAMVMRANDNDEGLGGHCRATKRRLWRGRLLRRNGPQGRRHSKL